MKVLVVYASRHGSTQEIAAEIDKELSAQGRTVELMSAKDIADISDYDAVILGSAVHEGRWLPAARRFVDEFALQLVQLPTWLFSSGPVGSPLEPDDGQPLHIKDTITRIHARGYHLFPGKLDGKAWNEQGLVSGDRSPAGDSREHKEIQDWARNISQSLDEERKL